MKVIKFLFMLTIFLKSTIVCSSKCVRPNVSCIELCCKKNQYYMTNIEKCLDLPEFGYNMWLAYIQNRTKTGNVSFEEYGDCSLSPEQSVIQKCYVPNTSFIYNVTKVDLLLEYNNFPCNRFLDSRPILVLGWLILEHSPLLLPILLYFTCTKEDKNNQLGYKLISGYLTSMIATLFIYAFSGYTAHKMKSQDFLLIYLFYLHKFFATSTVFWLSCIGFNVYVQFKEANVRNTEQKDRKRFIWFSVYVWSGSLTICIASRMNEKFNMVSLGLTYLIVLFNIFAFLVLAVKISLIRCQVIGISTEKHMKCKLALVICRLCILMGIPRMLLWLLIPLIGHAPLTAMLYLEPYCAYCTFILQYKNCWSLFRCKFCCSASYVEENNRPVQDTTTIRQISV